MFLAAGLIAKARGLAILTVVKAGFLVTARGGSGIVIAKLDDDSKWNIITSQRQVYKLASF